MNTSGHRAQRTCLGCRQTLDQETLLRYVVSPQGELLVDYQGKLPGRGAYTCFEVDCIENALRRGQFRRALRGEFGPIEPAQLIEEVRRQVRLRIVNLIGMSRKAGVVVMGSNQVLDQLSRSGPMLLVLVAEDISEGVSAKVTARVRKEQGELYRQFDKITIGQMLGRGELSVVGFRESPLSAALKFELRRYRHITEGL